LATRTNVKVCTGAIAPINMPTMGVFASFPDAAVATIARIIGVLGFNMPTQVLL
jgi:hypothetical protein